jgi:hypothetical protein
MFGRRTIITDWAAEQELNDPFPTDRGSEGAFGQRPYEGEVDRCSHGELHADLGIQTSALPIDGYRQSGWLAFA